MDVIRNARLVLDTYANIIPEDNRCLPFFDENILDGLTLEASSVFRNEPGLLEANGEIVVVGDLHGHVFDLLRILRRFGMPPATKYAFLGDMVDRGPFSTETVSLIFALKVVYPKHVYVIRGNHEFGSLCSACGFLEELKSLKYSRALFDSFVSVFNVIPLALRINNDVICLHGGIGPNIRDLADIDRIPRSISELYGGIADSLVWSDPCEDVSRFEQSIRGRGFQFGRQALRSWLSNNGLRLLIRGHQSIEEGVRYGLDGLVVTVFSASNYCGAMRNNCGVVKLYANGNEELIVLDRAPFLERASVLMINPDGTPRETEEEKPPGNVRSAQSFTFTKTEKKLHRIKLVPGSRSSTFMARRMSLRRLKID